MRDFVKTIILLVDALVLIFIGTIVTLPLCESPDPITLREYGVIGFFAFVFCLAVIVITWFTQEMFEVIDKDV